ncbi:Ctr copper transporter family-domain-containing protein [Phyllosticta capitalensis]|uniref:Ctr copper transporter family-domain-containing protein n=1 Tax=Phyllosticta capitalensis TaxID=121624 RepID=UPI003131A78E
MDHSGMDHGGMDHGGHGGMDMGHKCNMNMLFTWDTTDLCIVFRGWHITGTLSLLFSLVAVALLCAGYEGVREVSRRYEASVAARQKVKDDGPGLPDRRRAGPWTARDQKRATIVKGVLYAVQVFYSFFIMLLFMTYNGWVMLSVAVGAFIGYVVFSNTSATKSVACH